MSGCSWRSSGSFRARRAANDARRPRARGGRHEQRPRPDTRREHLRRQQRQRRHRGVVDRSDRPLLLRHALPLAVGADRERAADEPAVGRRPAVLRNALLPGSRDRDGVHRREALRDPTARGRQRLPRGADDPQPRRETSRPRSARRRGLRLRRPVRGEGRAREEGEVLRQGRVRPTAARLPAGTVHARDADLGIGARPSRQERSHLQGAHPAPRRLVDRPGRRHRVRRRRHLRTAEVRTRSAAGSTEHGAEPGEVARGGTASRMRPGGAPGDLQAQPRRSRGASLFAARRGWPEPSCCRTALVHDHVRPGQHLHEPAGASLHARARRDHAARARRLAGQPRRRLPRRGSGSDPPRDALRGDDGLRGAAALPLLRLRRCDTAVHRAARRVRALDGRQEARTRPRAAGAEPRSTGSTSTRISWAPGTSGTGGETRRPASRTSAGRTHGTRSPIATERFPVSRGRPASCRDTRTTRRSAAHAWRGSYGRTRRWRTSWRRMLPT